MRCTEVITYDTLRDLHLGCQSAFKEIEVTKTMPQGDKRKYTDKQKRMARHIEESYEAGGVSEKEAERRAWATVNKETGGGRKPGGSGRGMSESEEHRRRSAAAKKGWETRRRSK
ncbi:MAG: hypothetical protein KF812_09550 [Fimbriimonadaceae bacterium]|nr:hypothetical protein [Fimbriimonadaceae bacterium]